MFSIPVTIVAAHGGERRLVYSAEQIISDEPHTIVSRIFRYPPGMGPDGEFVEGRQWPDEEVDVMVSISTMTRLGAKVTHVA